MNEINRLRDMYECLECGYSDNINYMIVSTTDTSDPSPVVTCPVCGGVCEKID